LTEESTQGKKERERKKKREKNPDERKGERTEKNAQCPREALPGLAEDEGLPDDFCSFFDWEGRHRRRQSEWEKAAPGGKPEDEVGGGGEVKERTKLPLCSLSGRRRWAIRPKMKDSVLSKRPPRLLLALQAQFEHSSIDVDVLSPPAHNEG